jgi:hypothetical protein
MAALFSKRLVSEGKEYLSWQDYRPPGNSSIGWVGEERRGVKEIDPLMLKSWALAISRGRRLGV